METPSGGRRASFEHVVHKMLDHGFRTGRQMSTTKTSLPKQLLNKDITQWVPIKWGRWRYEDHITLGEGRASLHLLAALALLPNAHDFRVLSLEDNAPWGHAAAKGRSPAIGLNYLLRRKCALSIASQIILILPWVQSCDMPADELSRFL